MKDLTHGPVPGFWRMLWRDRNGVEGNSLAAASRARFAGYPPGAQIEVFRGVGGHMWRAGDAGPRFAARTVPFVGRPGRICHWTRGVHPLGSPMIDAALNAGATPWTSSEKANPSPDAKMFVF